MNIFLSFSLLTPFQTLNNLKDFLFWKTLNAKIFYIYFNRSFQTLVLLKTGNCITSKFPIRLLGVSFYRQQPTHAGVSRNTATVITFFFVAKDHLKFTCFTCRRPCGNTLLYRLLRSHANIFRPIVQILVLLNVHLYYNFVKPFSVDIFY